MRGVGYWVLSVGALVLGAPSLAHAQTPADTGLRPSAAAPLRDTTRLPARPPIRLTFTGDINLGTTFLPNGVPAESLPSAMAQVDSLFDGDLNVGNYEGAFSDTLRAGKCRGSNNCYEFRTPRWMARHLWTAGFTHMHLANNHASDLGLAGRHETRALFDSLGIRYYGILGDISIDTVRTADGACPERQRGGLRTAADSAQGPRRTTHDVPSTCATTVALVGFTTYDFAYSLLNISRARTVVDSVAKLADIVVVTFHGGTEGKAAVRTGRTMERMGGERRGDLRRFARAVIDAGADAVVGHGPHVLRGIEFYRGRAIAYSLGNFVTWHGFNMTGVNALTGVLQLEIHPDGRFASGRFVPLRQVKWVGAVPDRSREALALVRRLTGLDFPGTGAVIASDGTFRAPPPVARRPSVPQRTAP